MMISRGFDAAFLALQSVNTAFLLLHDWVPLGRLSNLVAMRGEDSLASRVYVTLLGALPIGGLLYFCARRFDQPYPHSLTMWLWITYGIFLAGLLRAWWIPYCFGTDPERAARYRVIFAGTHAFLPERHGMAPDTLHTLFHGCVVATMVMLALR